MKPTTNARVTFPHKFIVLRLKASYIVINGDIGHSIRLSNEDYEVFKDLLRLCKQNADVDDIIALISYSKSMRKMMLRLLASAVVLFSNNQEQSTNCAITRFPEHVYLGLTDTCNLDCVYCYGSFGDKKVCSYLSFEKAKMLVDELVLNGANTIYLTGGEPLINPNCLSIGEYIVSKGLKCVLMTNGALINENDIELYKLFAHVRLSLDSHLSLINDVTRGRGVYEDVISKIELLSKNNINVYIGSVITQHNKDTLKEFILHLRNKYSITDHSFAHYIPSFNNRDHSLSCSIEELIVCDNDISSTFSDINTTKGIITIFTGNKNWCCGMGVNEVFINPSGDLYPCRMTYTSELRGGNIFIDGYANSLKKLAKIHEKINVDKLECRSCMYKYLCGGACRVYHSSFSASIYENSPDVCKFSEYQIIKHILHKYGLNYTHKFDVFVLETAS